MKEGCRVTPGGGNPRESATEKSLLRCRRPATGGSGVMVKRWGKSPPRTWQQGRYGKPHPEQCRIGAPPRKGPEASLATDCRGPPRGTFSPGARVGSLTTPVTALAEEWSSKGGSSRDRIRLTDPPRICFSGGVFPPGAGLRHRPGRGGFTPPCSIGRANGNTPVGLFAQGMRRWAGRGRRSGALATGGGGMRQSWHSQGGLTCPGSTARCGSMPPHGQETGWARQVPMFSSATRSCPCGDQE